MLINLGPPGFRLQQLFGLNNPFMTLMCDGESDLLVLAA